MQIVIFVTGTRGDVQPSIALGRALRSAGYNVRLAAGANFRRWTEHNGLEPFSTLDSSEVLASPEGVRWIESSRGIGELQAMKRLSRAFAGRTVDDVLRGTQGAGLLIGGMIEEPYLQAVAEKHAIPQITLALQPYRPTRSAPASMLRTPRSTGSPLNRWSTMLAQRLVWTISAGTTNRIRAALGLAPHTAASFARAALAIPALYAFSPRVVPPVTDANAYTTGYCFLDYQTPLPPELLGFIEAGDAPVYIGFGSMTSSDPRATLRMAADALARLGRRGVVAIDAQVAADALPEHLCSAANADHASLFPRMAALVHHGGAGTTAAGLRAGVPALIVPHMADQPYWGRRVYQLGAGVEPVPRVQLTAQRLEQQLRVLLGDTQFRPNAARLGEQIRAEHGVDNAVRWIESYMTRQAQ